MIHHVRILTIISNHDILRAHGKLATVQSMKTNQFQIDLLFPLFAIGITTILCIAIVASYVNTANMKATVILPGGVTYLGK